FGDDRSQSFSAWSGYQIVNNVDVWIGLTRRLRLARKNVSAESIRDRKCQYEDDYRCNSHLNVHLGRLVFCFIQRGIFSKNLPFLIESCALTPTDAGFRQ